MDAWSLRSDEFRSSWWGYSVDDVDGFLETLAIAIEAGRSPAPTYREAQFRRSVRGYERAQVDSYLRQFVSEYGGAPVAGVVGQPAWNGHWDHKAVKPLVLGLVIGIAVVAALTAWIVSGAAGSGIPGRSWSWLSGGGPRGEVIAVWAVLFVFTGGSFCFLCFSDWVIDHLMIRPVGWLITLWIVAAVPLCLFSLIMLCQAIGIDTSGA